MNYSINSLCTLRRTIFRCTTLFFCIGGITQSALADQLPAVTGANFDGSVITWQAVDTATGYNIYLDFRYVDTVNAGTAYVPEIPGEYRIAAFDDNGNYSPLQVIDSDVVPTTNIAIVDVADEFLEPPLNVSGTVFSSTAGEIYWDRDNARSLEYTITVNGVEVDRTAGASYWTTSLQANFQNTVTVQVSSRNGFTSEPVGLLFDTRQSSFPMAATELDPNIPDGDVEIPQNPRLEIYSSTAAELFWDRAPASEQIAFTEVYRDRNLIGTSPGNSFYDDVRRSGATYTYELIAVDVEGNRSDSGFINPGPFDNNNDDDLLKFVSGISDVTNRNPHVQWYPLISAIRFGTLPDDVIELSSEANLIEGVVVVTTFYECDSGLIVAEQVDGYSSTAEISFQDCVTNNVLFSGIVSIFSEGGLFESVDYLDLFILDEDADVSVNGNVTSARDRARDARSINYDSFAYYIIGNLFEETALDTSVELNQTIAYDADGASATSTFTTSFNVSAPWTRGRTVNITTNDDFSAFGGYYNTGFLTAEFENGDNLILSADTGFEDTWAALFSDVNGSRGTTGNWVEMFRLPCIVSDDECR